MAEFNAKECERLAGEMAEDDIAVSGDNYNAWMDASQRLRNNAHAASEQLRAACAEVERLTVALTKISAIRDSIVGMQGFNFSEHAYPLVATLDAAGFMGAGYEISRANLGTLIEQRNKAESERDRLAAECERLRKLNGDRSETAREQLAEADAARALANIANECRASAERELERWRHGVTIEGDYVCPDSLALTEARALVERLKELNKHIHSIAWTAGRREAEQAMAPNLAALTSDLAKYRALVEAYAPVRDLIGDWKWTDMDWSDLRDSDLAERVVGALAETERRIAITAAPKEKL